MATSYTIRAGYNSGCSREEAEAMLLRIVKSICAEPDQLIRDASRVERKDVPASFAEMYREPWEDLTIRAGRDDEDTLAIWQSASGGGEERDFKEIMRRAMCRLVMERMHRVGMEVSISVF